MRLTELNPKWIGIHNISAGVDIRIGMRFDCPGCRQTRIVVAFANPIDPANALANTTWRPGIPLMAGLQWSRTGDTFDSISLVPSIDRSEDGHWHGCVNSGEISTSSASCKKTDH